MWHAWADLGFKAHKNENFFSSNFVPFHCKLYLHIKNLGENFFDCTMTGGALIVPMLSLETKLNKNFFQGSCFYIIWTLLYLQIIDFPKWDPSAETGMALRVNLEPKNVNLFFLV